MLSERMHGGISAGTISQLTRRIQYLPGGDFVSHIKSIHSPLRSWTLFTGSLTKESNQPFTKKLRALAMLLTLPDLLHALQRATYESSAMISYVGPSRATGERYYRMQELAVDEIDPQGKNLPMFLHSLPRNQLTAFSKWLEEALGYAIQIGQSAGHIQIELRDLTSDIYYNMADMGYGFSQILPIMAQIWSREYRRLNVSYNSILAMEQPELHLHPAYQAKLADVLARTIRDQSDVQNNKPRRKIGFVIETHSEAIVNRIGELIMEGSINHEDVAIYIFEKRPSDRSTNIRKVNFDEDGTLRNWPIGFFSTKSL
jgi:predicted ATPase